MPSLIHRVETAAEIGDAITQSARIALLNDHAAGGVGRDDIGQTQAGANAFRKPRDMPADVRRDGRQRRGAMRWDEPVGVVFDDRDLEPAREPGKSEVPIERFFEAFAAAVPVFGRGQVSTYLLAGLGDPAESIIEACERLIVLGVYPFVVPFVPISGTPLESHAGPTPEFMHVILNPLAELLVKGGLRASDIKAGCGKCGACSALSIYERRLAS